MRVYEMMLVTEKEEEQLLEKVKQLLEREGVESVQMQSWGRRELAYPIKKRKEGFYYLLSFDAAPSLIIRIREALKFEEGILRFMITKREV
jgi:small subunit ribosomal protein S6